AAQVRADIGKTFAGVKELDGIAALGFGRPVAAQHWLQASNPSERWKWDFMFQDLPPVKGNVEPSALPMPAGAIPLKEVKKRLASHHFVRGCVPWNDRSCGRAAPRGESRRRPSCRIRWRSRWRRRT